MSVVVQTHIRATGNSTKFNFLLLPAVIHRKTSFCTVPFFLKVVQLHVSAICPQSKVPVEKHAEWNDLVCFSWFFIMDKIYSVRLFIQSLMCMLASPQMHCTVRPTATLTQVNEDRMYVKCLCRYLFLTKANWFLHFSLMEFVVKLPELATSPHTP